MLAVVPSAENVFIPSFADFWSLYPRRVARKDAERAWQRLSADERIDATIAISKWRAVWVARGEMQYVPHASSWLRGERWEDELPTDCAPNHASHVMREVKTEPEAPRVVPQHVIDMIARMKAK